MIKGFYVAADAVLHGTYIPENRIRGNIFRVDHTSNIQLIDDIFKGKTVYLGNQFGLCDMFLQRVTGKMFSSSMFVSVTKDSVLWKVLLP